MSALSLVQERLVQYPLPNTQFYEEVFPKKSICLHHTAGGTAASSIETWKNNPVKVATCVVIDRDGKILQAFGSQYWAYSIGLSTANYKKIEQQMVGIEIASYGGLTLQNGIYKNAYNGTIAPTKVYDHGKKFRGFRYFEKYTTAQIESVKRLLLLWKEKYGINISYHDDMWALSDKAIKGAPGLWTHVSYRADKSDCFPQPELVAMMKNLV